MNAEIRAVVHGNDVFDDGEIHYASFSEPEFQAQVHLMGGAVKSLDRFNHRGGVEVLSQDGRILRPGWCRASHSREDSFSPGPRHPDIGPGRLGKGLPSLFDISGYEKRQCQPEALGNGLGPDVEDPHAVVQRQGIFAAKGPRRGHDQEKNDQPDNEGDSLFHNPPFYVPV